jgi:hypothetical protein
MKFNFLNVIRVLLHFFFFQAHFFIFGHSKRRLSKYRPKRRVFKYFLNWCFGLNKPTNHRPQSMIARTYISQLPYRGQYIDMMQSKMGGGETAWWPLPRWKNSGASPGVSGYANDPLFGKIFWNWLKIHYTETNIWNSPWESGIFEKTTPFQNLCNQFWDDA